MGRIKLNYTRSQARAEANIIALLFAESKRTQLSLSLELIRWASWGSHLSEGRQSVQIRYVVVEREEKMPS